MPQDEQADLRRPCKISDRQAWAIDLTVQGYTDAFIASKVGVDPKTIWRWKTLDDEYRDVLNDARMHIHSGVGDRFRILLNRTSGILAKFMNGEDEDKRFRAAYAVLTMSGSFRPQPLKPPPIGVDDLDLPNVPPEWG